MLGREVAFLCRGCEKNYRNNTVSVKQLKFEMFAGANSNQHRDQL